MTHNVTLEPKAYRTRVWCDGVYLGSLFRNYADGKLGGYWAAWQEGDRKIDRLLFATRKGGVDYLIESAEALGRLA
jgi:hypothetical protein